MNSYQDRWSRWHDKPCPGGEPSSNNGWIYTAFAVKCGLPVTRELLEDCFRHCKSPEGKIHRNPGRTTPPLSRDEVLGLCALKLLSAEDLLKDNWNFSPYPSSRFRPVKTLSALWRMRKAHRNQLWLEKGEPDLFRFAFSVPWSDRAFIYRTSGRRAPLLYSLIESLDKCFPGRSPSSRMIRFLKYNQMPGPMILKTLPFLPSIQVI